MTVCEHILYYVAVLVAALSALSALDAARTLLKSTMPGLGPDAMRAGAAHL